MKKGKHLHQSCMDIDTKYNKYYHSYLGIHPELSYGSEPKCVSSEQRNIPMCHYYYHEILYSQSNDFKVLSCAPQHFEMCQAVFHESSYDNQNVYLLLKEQFPDYQVRRFYRMGITHNDAVLGGVSHNGKVITLDKTHKDMYVDCLIKSGVQRKKADQKWEQMEEFVREGRWFVLICDGKIVSRAYISDLDYGGGNISVWTDPEYVRNGYAKAVTAEAVKWCADSRILPVYLVEQNNTASIHTALSLGFTTLFNEIIVSRKKYKTPEINGISLR